MSWNDASALCETQFGQLVKVRSQRTIEELDYLDDTVWMGQLSAAQGVWTGLHQPFANTSWVYQDCQPIESGFLVLGGSTDATSAPTKCALLQNGNTLTSEDCAKKYMFICRRIKDDCWFEPFLVEQPAVISAATSVALSGYPEASACAMQCRNYFHPTNGECWGFTFYEVHEACNLFPENSDVASSKFLRPENREQGLNDSVFYVRRCFEGILDTKTYAATVNNGSDPATKCSTDFYHADNTVPDVCFCSTTSHPVIPEPVSAEDRAKQYAEELILDAHDTGAASRKLTSAEDNRASAVSVGFVGVGLLTAVFGGLVLLDLNVVIILIKKLFCSKMSS